MQVTRYRQDDKKQKTAKETAYNINTVIKNLMQSIKKYCKLLAYNILYHIRLT